MRTIKFRAWYKHEKHYRSWEDILTHRYNERWFIDNTDKEYINCIFTDPDITLEQYIGTNTKNGKEIYEGDIIHRINRSSCCGKIKYEETQIVKREGTGFYGFPLPDSPLGSCGFADISSEEVEIIGNIHENPALLE